MEMRDCPKFISCSAPVCPLGDITVSHLRGEPICKYLMEQVKPGGKARLRGCLAGEMVDTIGKALPQIQNSHGDIKKRLQRASETGSKMDAFKMKKMAAA